MSKKILERDIVEYCRKRVAAYGGEMRKVKWEGRRSAPDWLIMLPANTRREGRALFVEFKAPGKHPTEAQQRELNLMRRSGLSATYFNSFDHVDCAFPL